MRRAWFVASGLAAVFMLVTMAVPGTMALWQGFDDAVWDLMVTAQSDVVVAIAEFLDLFGGVTVMIVFALVVAGVLWRSRGWQLGLAWLVALTATFITNSIIKAIYERPRPPDGLIVETTFSFPSGHAMISAAVAAALLTFFVGNRWSGGPRWVALAGTYVFLVSMSRVYLRVHWMTDVITGVLLGLVIAWAVAGWATSREQAYSSSA